MPLRFRFAKIKTVMKLNTLIYIFIGALLLAGLFLFVKSQNKTAQDSMMQSSANPVQASTNSGQVAHTKTFELEVKNRKLVSGSDSLQVNQGDNVTIKITVDEDDELHLHGYDKSVDLTANQPDELNFVANVTGRFPYELEHSKTELGALEVLPK